MSKKRDPQRRPHKSRRPRKPRDFFLNATGGGFLWGGLLGGHDIGWLRTYRQKRAAWSYEARARHGLLTVEELRERFSRPRKDVAP